MAVKKSVKRLNVVGRKSGKDKVECERAINFRQSDIFDIILPSKFENRPSN